MNGTVNPDRIWRSGKLLVMHKNAVLPDRCVKTNKPTSGVRLKRKLYWHHPALYLLVLVNVLLYAIVALCVRKNAKIEIGVTQEILTQRKKAIFAAWICCLGGIALFIFGVANLDSHGIFLLFGVILFLAGLIWGAVKTPVVSPARIDTDYVWLKGVNPNYLASFPEWEKR